jgi:hypothetical protein
MRIVSSSCERGDPGLDIPGYAEYPARCSTYPNVTSVTTTVARDVIDTTAHRAAVHGGGRCYLRYAFVN